METEENKCVICGKSESQDTKSDYIRECYEMNQDGNWDRGLFCPRLNFIEMAYIKQGFNYVCSNRTMCRARQQSNSKRKRALQLMNK